MRFLRLTILILVFALAFPAALSSQAQESPIEDAECLFEVPEGITAECGYLSVPESRSGRSNATIRLYFARIASTGDDPSSYPVIYLSGGPGGNGVEFPDWAGVILAYTDLILLDQRGTGYSEPSLNCIELELGDKDELEATQACRDRLASEGIDLAAYNTVENAADLDDLRVALGIEQWTLYGISYGTRLALEALRQTPEALRSVVIDAVYPPNVFAYEEQGPNTVKQFKVLFDGCAKDAACNAAFPNLEQAFYTLVAELDAEPAEYTVTDPESGEDIENTLDGGQLVDILFQAMYDTERIPSLPKALWLAINGDYAEAVALITGGDEEDEDEGNNRRQRRADDVEEDLSDSEGMNLSVDCAEEGAFINMERVTAALRGAPEAIVGKLISDVERITEQCKIWNVPALPASFKEAVRSGVPVLVLNGEYDPITPPAWGDLAAETLSSGYSFTFPGVGHGAAATSPCADSIIAAFLDDPDSEPDGACIADLAPPRFVTD
ncbi:MAG: alpha/beta hydrolase [Chloroflexi bacterium CFX4]|nr:alpha/beta hydrolase [Chloroflexi bacterium CFX4]MDL1922420.1 alpha/beta hydrolase [Chloroflexi bacterium CFX3]